jgi:hypothetical protein
MKQVVSLTRREVNEAILDYAEKHGVRLDGMVATVDVVATRGDRELYATIELEPHKEVLHPYDKAIKDLQDGNFDLEEVDPDEGVPIVATQEIDDETEVFG